MRVGARFETCVRILALAWLVIGCVQSQSVPCGDGRVCPVGTSCAVEHGLCIVDEQVAACEGIPEGEPCSFGAQIGICDRGVCVATACGNGEVDPGEECDDGNAEGGDGCAADCAKLEMCGDAAVDVGEACDDGNDNPNDGCDACAATVWRASAVIGGTPNATAVGLFQPQQIAVDPQGNLYIADAQNHRVRRVGRNGVVVTVAGTGMNGYSGDGGAATNARLDNPTGVAVDGLGNLYIAERSSYRLRRVDPAGIITTIAGTGAPGTAGDGGPATAAQLSTPSRVAVDGLGNVFVLDGHRIRKIDTTGRITTVAGSVSAGVLNGPTGLAIAGETLYIADTGNALIRRIKPGGTIETVVGGGSDLGEGVDALAARLAYPVDVAVDADGLLVIVDWTRYRVRRVGSDNKIRTIVGTGASGFSGDGGPASDATLQLGPGAAIAFAHDAALYIADQGNQRVRRVDASTGVVSTYAGSGTLGYTGDGGTARGAVLSYPSGVALDGAGNLYIVDNGNSAIRRVDPAGVITTIAGGRGLGYAGDGGPATAAMLRFPLDVAVDAAGNLYIADTENHVVRRVDTSGIITTVAGTGVGGFSGDGTTTAQLNMPSAVAVDAAGNLYITDTNNQRIRRRAPNGVITTFAGTGTRGPGGDGGPATSAELDEPGGLAVDGAGNVYVADILNNRIRRIDADGVITTVAGTGTYGFSGDGGAATGAQLDAPLDVAIASNGDVLIADTNNGRIRRVSGGVITTIAGSAASYPGGFAGDGGAATSALLRYPHALVGGAADTIYFSDRGNERVARIDGAGTITTRAGALGPENLGPTSSSLITEPRALAIGASFTLFAGGSSGTLLAATASPAWLDVVAGRYPHDAPTGTLARFRDASFGTVVGVAFDPAGIIYITESSAHRLHAVTVTDPGNPATWTIETLANASGTAGFLDGPASTARFRAPTGLFLDAAGARLYVTDSGNHVVRAIDLSNGIANATVSTVAGTPETRGYAGDGDSAAGALLFDPSAITRCASGDLFVADTGNHRVRRISGGVISTVLGDGGPASSGEGVPASSFPVSAPLGLACDVHGNVFVTSTSTVRLLAAIDGAVDGSGPVQTIYGALPRDEFPASVTSCLTGVAVVDGDTVQVTDSCTGILVELQRGAP